MVDEAGSFSGLLNVLAAVSVESAEISNLKSQISNLIFEISKCGNAAFVTEVSWDVAHKKGIVMSRFFLKGLSLAGLCLLALAAAPSSRANDACPTCQQQTCPTCPQQCPSCPGYCRTGGHDCCLKPIVKWAVCPSYYILPPDYGWNSPVKVPVVRRGVTYYRYHPEQWYGTGTPAAGQYRTYPQVYSPTDTTQLGYTYQQVPYWQPAPYRLPQPPVPPQWHVRDPHRGYHGRWHDSYTPIHHHQAANVQYWSSRSATELGHSRCRLNPQDQSAARQLQHRHSFRPPRN